MLFLCIIIFILAGYKYLQFNQKHEQVDFSSFKSQISKLEKQVEIDKEYVAKKRSNWSYKDKKSFSVKKKLVPLSIELNSTDTSELKQIYGIGSILAKRIIKYRDLLGGFHSEKQLLDVYAMDTNAYEDFKHQVFVDLSLVKKIDINFADANELSKHPFINYKLANSIVNYRVNHGSFSKSHELINLHLIDSVTLNKMLPYINFDD